MTQTKFLLAIAGAAFALSIAAAYGFALILRANDEQQIVCTDSTITSSATMKLTVAVQECEQ